jgi:nucleosome binding factor SPN SPT16 subunit
MCLSLFFQKRIGTFNKEAPIGKVAEEWKKAYNERKTKEGFEDVDVGAAFASLWASKDDEEQVCVQQILNRE